MTTGIAVWSPREAPMNNIAMTAQIINAVVVQSVIALLTSLARRDKVASSAWMAPRPVCL